jgi:hypothetical protein
MLVSYVSVAQIPQLDVGVMANYTPLMVHNYVKSCQSCSELIYTEQDFILVKAKHGAAVEYFHMDYTGCQVSMSRARIVYPHDSSRRVTP